MTRALPALLLALAVLALGACSSGSERNGRPGKAAGERPPATNTTVGEVKALLDRWAKRLVKPWGLIIERGKAYKGRHLKRARRLERRLVPMLRPLEAWPQEAARRLQDRPPTRPVRAAIRLGNVWGEFAHRFRDGLRKGFTKRSGEKLGRLQGKGFRSHIRVYRLLPRRVAPEFLRPPFANKPQKQPRKRASSRSRRAG
jgi:hypothetical protein